MSSLTGVSPPASSALPDEILLAPYITVKCCRLLATFGDQINKLEENDMLSDSRKKLRKLTKVLFILAMIGCVILAFLNGFPRLLTGQYYKFKDFQAVPFFLWLIGGFFVCYLEALVLTGFCDLLDTQEQIRQEIKQIRNSTFTSSQQEQEKHANNTPPSAGYTENTPSPKSNVEAGANKDLAAVIPLNSDREGSIICPACGTVQRADRRMCWHCSIPFKYE